MKLFLVTGTVLAVLAGPAFASECPSLIQKAEEAMKMAKLDDAKMKKITDHIAQAKSEHEAGKHDDAVVTAKDALQLTGM